MSALSAARRVRARFISFGFWTSAVAFVVIEGDALLDQSEIGHASTLFMLGTACLAAAACLGLFAIITMSVLIQVGVFKVTKWRTGKPFRVFKIAPLQHHFEQVGWAETTIVVRFWLIAGMFVALGLGIFYVAWFPK